MNAQYLTSSIALSLARAAWWTAYANTPANLGRIVSDGHGRRFTPNDLIDDAMGCANTHLSRAQEMLDQLNTLNP